MCAKWFYSLIRNLVTAQSTGQLITCAAVIVSQNSTHMLFVAIAGAVFLSNREYMSLEKTTQVILSTVTYRDVINFVIL